MSMELTLRDKLQSQLQPSHLEVINESASHNVPPGSESHFKVVVVSEAFTGKSLIAQHRLINEILADELKNKIHALALHTYTASDWNQRTHQSPPSPPCRGGDKKL